MQEFGLIFSIVIVYEDLMNFLSKLFYSDVFFTFIIEYPILSELIQGAIIVIYFLVILLFLFILFFAFLNENHIQAFILMTIITSLCYYYYDFNNQSKIVGINYYVSQNPNGLYSKHIREECIPNYLHVYKSYEFYPFVLSCVQSYAKGLLADQKRQWRQQIKIRDEKIELDKRQQEMQKVKEKFKIN